MITQHGFKPIKYHRSDYSYKKTFGSTTLPGLPPEGLGRVPLKIYDQGSSNYCTAAATAAASSYQEHLPLSFEFQTAAIGQIEGAPIYNGAVPDNSLKALTKIGSRPEGAISLSFAKEGWFIPASMTNYTVEERTGALDYAKQAYFKVTAGGPDDMDYFDSIKLALHDSRTEDAVVIAYGYWYPNWNLVAKDGIIPAAQGTTQFRHAYCFIDWRQINGIDYLVAHLSSGNQFGDNGLVYFTREVVNAAFQNMRINGLGLYILRDNPIGGVSTVGFDWVGWIREFMAQLGL